MTDEKDIARKAWNVDRDVVAQEMGQLSKGEEALALIVAEFLRATRKFGTFASAHEGYAILLEEVDELWEEVKKGSSPKYLQDEAVQVGAMALRFIIDVCMRSDP